MSGTVWDATGRRRHPRSSVGGLLRLTRPLNALLSGLGAIVGALASGSIFFLAEDAWRPVVLVTISAILGTAGGNALNDLVDIKVDRAAHPKRPLPSGRVTQRAARRLVLAAWATAVPAAMLANAHAGLLAAFDVALLSAYEMRLKRLGLPGNIAVALVAGSLFPLGALAVGGDLLLPTLLGLIAATAHLGRELLKDAEDRIHDRATRRTFAVRHGPKATAALALTSFVIAIGLSMMPYVAFGWTKSYLGTVLVADLLFAVAAAVGFVQPGRGRAIAKGAMVVAVLAFLVGSLGL